MFPVSSSPSAVHSGEVQERGRGHVHRQDLEAEHALHHQEVQPSQQPPQAPHGNLTPGMSSLLRAEVKCGCVVLELKTRPLKPLSHLFPDQR